MLLNNLIVFFLHMTSQHRQLGGIPFLNFYFFIFRFAHGATFTPDTLDNSISKDSTSKSRTFQFLKNTFHSAIIKPVFSITNLSNLSLSTPTLLFTTLSIQPYNPSIERTTIEDSKAHWD